MGRRRPATALVVLSVLVSVAALLPVLYLAVRASEGGWSLVTDTLLRRRTAALVGRSVALALAVTAAATVVAVVLAWLAVRTDLPGRRVWRVAAALPLAVPTYVAGLAWSAQFPRMQGFFGAWLLLTLYAYPYAYLPVAAALARLDPAPAEVARSLGLGPRATFVRVTARQVRPAIAGGALLVALYALSDFGAVSLMRFTAFTRAIYLSYQASFDRRPAAVLGCVLVVITIAVVALELRTRGRARHDPAGRGAVRSGGVVRLGGWRWPAFGFAALVTGTALGVPAVTLARWTAVGVSDPATVTDTARAATSSLSVSLLGAVVTTAAAVPVALLAARHRTRLARFAEASAYAGHALPGVVVALSLVFFSARYAGALYQTVPVLVFAYAVLFLPLGVAAVQASAVQAAPVLDDVARSLGASSRAVLARVTAPLLAPGVAAGAALVFLTCMKELPATLLLRPTGVDTLATRVWSETSVGAYAAAAPPAALLVLVAAVPTWLLARRTDVAA